MTPVSFGVIFAYQRILLLILWFYIPVSTFSSMDLRDRRYQDGYSNFGVSRPYRRKTEKGRQDVCSRRVLVLSLGIGVRN